MLNICYSLLYIGSKCTIGAKSKLNGCVVMSGVSIADGYAHIYKYTCMMYMLLYTSICDMLCCIYCVSHTLVICHVYVLCQFFTLIALFLCIYRCTIQNSVICANAIIEGNCSINDCQISEGVTVSAGTKIKGEVLTA